MQFKILISCCLLATIALFSCTEKNAITTASNKLGSNKKELSKSDKPNNTLLNNLSDQGIPSITENGKAIDLIEFKEEQILRKLSPISKFDSVAVVAGDCQEIFCRLAGHNMFRKSKSGKYMLEYDPTTSVNTIYDASSNKLGSIKIEANNPEYGITTLPLENEPGILFVDAQKHFSKYKTDGGKMKLDWKIDIGPDYFTHSYHMLNKENALMVFRRNHNNNAASFDKYSMSDGKLLGSKSLEPMPFETKYAYDDDLMAIYDRKKVIIYDFLNNNNSHEIPAKGIINLIAFTRNDSRLAGLFMDDSGINRFSIDGDKITSSIIKLDPKYSCSRLFAEKETLAINYFQTNTPGLYSNDTKLMSQGVILINDQNSKTYIMKCNSVADYLSMHTSQNALILKQAGKVFNMDLTQIF